MIKKKELHNMKDQELIEEADRLRKRLYDLRCQAITEKLENPRQFGNLRRDIARIMTEQRTRQLKQETAQ